MLVCTAHLKSITPYSCGGRIDITSKPANVKHEEWDIQKWKDKATYNEAGIVVIPQMALKMAVDEAAKRLNIKIEGRGKSTYTKFFLAGQICDADVPIGIHRDDLESIEIQANLDGRRGGSSRGPRHFPYIREWAGVARFAILDPILRKDVFEAALINAGKLVGVGRFRPERGGFLGRFSVTKIAWSEE